MKRSVKRARQRELEEKIQSLKSVSEATDGDNQMDIREQFLSKFVAGGANQDADDQVMNKKRQIKANSKVGGSKEQEEAQVIFDVVSKLVPKRKIVTASEQFSNYFHRQNMIDKKSLDAASEISRAPINQKSQIL